MCPCGPQDPPVIKQPEENYATDKHTWRHHITGAASKEHLKLRRELTDVTTNQLLRLKLPSPGKASREVSLVLRKGTVQYNVVNTNLATGET